MNIDKNIEKYIFYGKPHESQGSTGEGKTTVMALVYALYVDTRSVVVDTFACLVSKNAVF